MNRTVRDAFARLIPAGTAAVCLLLAAGCEAMVPYNWESAESDGERTELILETVAAPEAVPMTVAVPHQGMRAGLQTDPILIEGRISKLISRTQATSARPPFAWGARTAGDFYAAPPRLLGAPAGEPSVSRVEVKPGVRGFKLVRSLENVPVTTLEFSIEPAEDAFRVTLNRITVHYSRAKVADCSWINWWARIPLIYGFGFDIARVFGVEYGDDAVDMQIDLGFNSAWMNARGESHRTTLAVLGWTILDVPLDGKAHEVGQSSGWLPMPPPSMRASEDGDVTFGTGHFALWAVVIEQDELAEDFVAEHKTLGEYFDEILGLLPVPVPFVP